jgi:AraC-like DNA-binding protein
MSALELAFRLAACTQLGLLGTMLFRRRTESSGYHYAALLAFGVAAYLLAPLAMRQWHWGVAGYPIILVAIVVPAFFWYFANAVFVDSFKPGPWAHALLAATAVVGFAAFCTQAQALRAVPLPAVPEWVAQTAKLLWIAAAFITVLKDWQADLVESRRRLRLLIVVAVGCYMGAIVVVELFLADRITALAELVNVSVLLIAVTALCFHLLDINSTNLFAAMAKPAPQAAPQVSPLATQVVALMTQDRVYAVDPLTIGVLADRLRTQPYQLRRVINGELGYRNFNTFINRYRVREVAHRLALPEYRSTPLLTLALDAGFRSLAPFNRSFKDHYGVTPSEYRNALPNTNNHSESKT